MPTATTDTEALPGAREVLLRTAYLNLDPQLARLSSITDTLLLLLAAADPQTAENAAESLCRADHAYPHWQRAADQAAALGLVTAVWDAQRTRLRPPQDIDDAGASESSRGPVHLANLIEHHPALAAALIEHARALPDTWCTDLFRTPDPTAVPTNTTATAAPEAAPASDDYEDCPACAESGELCRSHQGQNITARGYTAMFELLATNPKAQELLARVAAGGAQSLTGVSAVATALAELQHDIEAGDALWAMAGRLQRHQEREQQSASRHAAPLAGAQ